MARQRSLDGLALRAVLPEELARWEQLMREQHYLHSSRMGGEVLRYVATIEGKWVALLGWGSGVLKCSARDRYIGWDSKTKDKRLFLIANNARFLVLIREKNLASKVLGMNVRRLSEDWQKVHGHPVYLAETFVDVASGYRGSCYRAANWVEVGRTEGWSKKGDRWERNGRPKAVYVYPLCSDAPRRLREDFVALESFRRDGEREGEVVERIDRLLGAGLMQQIREVKDPRHRRGIRHALAGVLGIAVCAVLCGERGFRAIGQWAKDLTESELKRFETGRREAPSEPTIRRVIHSVDAKGFDQRIGAWITEQQSLKGKGVAMDGKTLRGSAEGEKPGVHLLSAVLHKEGVVLAQESVGEKTNEIPCAIPLLDEIPLEGTTVTADALLTQRSLAEYLVEKRGADYVFAVKDNQPSMKKDIEDLELKKNGPTTKTSTRSTEDERRGRSG